MSEETLLAETQTYALSVIIPTKNSAKRISNCLKSLFHQSFKSFEVIIVDGHSTDDTVRLASAFPVTVCYENYGTRGGACNVGAQNAKGDILVFTDDDCLFPPDWLRQVYDCFAKNPHLTAFGGLDVNVEDDTLSSRSRGIFDTYGRQETASDIDAVFRIKGCNSAYQKGAFFRLGGFDPSLKYWEESELHVRMFCEPNTKNQLLFEPRIAINHYRHAESPYRIRKIMRYGVPVLTKRDIFMTSLKAHYSAAFTTYLLCGALLGFIAVTLLFGFLFPQNILTIIGVEFVLGVTGLFLYALTIVFRARKKFTKSELAIIPFNVFLDTALKVVGLTQGLFDLVQINLNKNRTPETS
ncbi:MAG: glycosyltransferase family 2 protein [Candidatus Bathyarchaeota archaeon]|nr:glycosyltransferase family 2 protein [Candidatus Bathyarchaeota archaeon]